ncbi:hypothetical protein FACS189490_12470 [Clostridia bacterium]|nr:hypothetical protein FACS189490_12470 [Clostridia bacterium]
MNEIINANTLDSREVAKLVGKRHADLIRDIETYEGYFADSQNADLRFDNFFIADAYNTGTGKNYKCYNITRKGCEFIANKLTGQKGTLFTAAYINRFHAMEQVLTSPVQLALPKPRRLLRRLTLTRWLKRCSANQPSICPL